MSSFRQQNLLNINKPGIKYSDVLGQVNNNNETKSENETDKNETIVKSGK